MSYERVEYHKQFPFLLRASLTLSWEQLICCYSSSSLETARGKYILEQPCCARFFMELENPALFSVATSLGRIKRDFQTPEKIVHGKVVLIFLPL